MPLSNPSAPWAGRTWCVTELQVPLLVTQPPVRVQFMRASMLSSAACHGADVIAEGYLALVVNLMARTVGRTTLKVAFRAPPRRCPVIERAVDEMCI